MMMGMYGFAFMGMMSLVGSLLTMFMAPMFGLMEQMFGLMTPP